MNGREFKELKTQYLDPALAALSAIAESQVEMLRLVTSEASVEIETGPPVCPHCGAVNPEVTQVQADGSGRLSDFVLAAEAHCCNHTIYAVPDGLFTMPDLQMVAALMNERKGGNGGS